MSIICLSLWRKCSFPTGVLLPQTLSKKETEASLLVLLKQVHWAPKLCTLQRTVQGLSVTAEGISVRGYCSSSFQYEGHWTALNWIYTSLSFVRKQTTGGRICSSFHSNTSKTDDKHSLISVHQYSAYKTNSNYSHTSAHVMIFSH